MRKKRHPLLLLTLIWVVACSRTKKVQIEPLKEKALSPVIAIATVDRALVSTEDSVTFSVTVNREKSIEIKIPDIGSRITGFRITDFGTEEKDEERSRKVVRHWFSLRADVAGSYVLPEIEIPYNVDGGQKSAKTSELFVEVSMPKPDLTQPSEQLRDIKDLERTQLNYVGWGAAVLAMIAVIGFFLYRRKRKSVPIEERLPPHESALSKLDELSLPNGSDPTGLKRFYFNLSLIIRSYVEERYGCRATDMTSEEIVRNLRNNSFLTESEKPVFIELLKETDIVKFTDFTPSIEAVSTVKDRARKFVFQTKPEEGALASESVV